MRYFVLTTRGLEDLVRDEIGVRIPAASRVETAYRRVMLEGNTADAEALMGLRCADDAFVQVAEWDAIGRARRTLEQITALSAALDLQPALALCAHLRPVAQPLHFAVSASFIGRRNYSSPEMKLALAEGIMQRHNWDYVEAEEEQGLSLRLFIEHERALLGVRLAAQPLHRRAYLRESQPGSLRPQVAAALLRLVGLLPGAFCVDPLCGAGTIVIEAALMGAQALGGEISGEALTLARVNLAASGARAELRHWDATALPLPAESVDCVASNLPFGRQVLPDMALSALYNGCVAEIARVLRPSGRAALLTTQHELLAAALAAQPTLRIASRREISLHGQNPVITIVEWSL